MDPQSEGSRIASIYSIRCVSSRARRVAWRKLKRPECARLSPFLPEGVGFCDRDHGSLSDRAAGVAGCHEASSVSEPRDSLEAEHHGAVLWLLN